MAAKNDKTTKTARVMNLLSKKPDPAATSVEEVAAPAAPQPPIAASIAPDAAVSVQIKNALESALETELPPRQTTAPAPVQQPAPQPVAEPEPPVEAWPEAVPTQPEPIQAPPAPTQEPERTFLEPENPGYINVMQVLVEEKAPKYVEMFGLCTCKRCMEDVKAITLNHLPPKYVVLEPGDRVPRLTVYEGKFSSDITAQLLQACKLVMERPHHTRG